MPPLSVYRSLVLGRTRSQYRQTPTEKASRLFAPVLVGALISSLVQEGLRGYLLVTAAVVLASFLLIAIVSMQRESIGILDHFDTPPVVACDPQTDEPLSPGALKDALISLESLSGEGAEVRILLYLDLATSSSLGDEAGAVSQLLARALDRSKEAEGPKLVLVCGYPANLTPPVWYQNYLRRAVDAKNTEVRFTEERPGINVVCIGREVAAWSHRIVNRKEDAERSFSVKGGQNRAAIDALRSVVEGVRRDAIDARTKMGAPYPESKEFLDRFKLNPSQSGDARSSQRNPAPKRYLRRTSEGGEAEGPNEAGK